MKPKRHSGPRPEEFALGSLSSRAAARLQLPARSQQNKQSYDRWLRSLPPYYRASVTEHFDPPMGEREAQIRREMEAGFAGITVDLWVTYGISCWTLEEIEKDPTFLNRVMREIRREREWRGMKPLDEQELRRQAIDMVLHPTDDEYGEAGR